MCVPWPFSSPAAHAAAAPVKSRLSATRPRRCGCRASTPVSMTATPMPRPVKPRSPSSRACPHLVGADRFGRHVAIVRTGASPETLGDVGVLAQIAQLPAGHLEDRGSCAAAS